MLQSLWHSRYIAACVCDLQGRVLYVNDAACGLLGRARATLVGGSFYDVAINSSYLYDEHQRLLSYAKAEQNTAELVKIMSGSPFSSAADPLSFWQVAAEDVAEAEVTLELRTSRGMLSVDAEVSCQQTSKGEVFLVHVLPVPANQPTITPLHAATQTPTSITTSTPTAAATDTTKSSDYHASVRHWLASVPEVFDSLLPGAIAIVDRDGVYHDIKNAPGFFTQVPIEQAIGKTFEEVLTPAAATERRQAIEHVFSSKKPYRFVDAQETPTGTRYFEIRYSYLDEQFCVGVKYDITEKQQLEHRLAASEARANAMLAAIPDGVATVSREGVFLHVQPPKDFQFEHLSPALIGKHLDDIPDAPVMREITRHYITQTLDSKQQHIHSYDVTIDGKTFYRDMRFSYLDDDTCLIMVRDVSDWMETALALQGVQARFDQFMRVTDDIFAVLDLAEQKLLYINPSYERLTGYSPRVVFSDLVSMRFLDTIDPRDHYKMHTMYDNLRRKRDCSLEYRLLCRDGSTRWMLLRCRVVLGGKTAVCVHTDISELKRSQAELAASRDQLHHVYNALPDAIARLNAQGEYISVKMPSYFASIASREKLLGSRIEDALPAATAATLREHFERTLKEGVMQVCRYDVPYQGEIVSREVRFTRLADGDVLGVYRDITKQRRAERALKRRNRDMQALIDAIPDSVFRLDADGICLEHKASGHFAVYPPSTHTNEMAGLAITDIAPPEIVPLLRHHMDTLRTTGVLQIFHYTLHRDGHMHYREARLMPMSNGEMLLLIRDISAVRRAELALLQRERDTRKLLEAFPDAIVRLNRAGVYVDIKPASYERYDDRLPASAMIGRTLEEVTPPELVPLLRERLTQTLETQSTQQFEYQLAKQGRTFYREARFVPLSSDEVLAIVRDVSSERRTQRQLEHREQQLQTILNTLPYDIARYDREGICLEHKPARYFEAFSPHASTGLVGKSLAEVAHPDAREVALWHFNALLESGQAQVFEYQLEHNGRTIYREATFLLLGDDEVLSILRDISEQRRLEQNLVKREQHISALFAALPDGIMHLNAEGVYLDIKLPHSFEPSIPASPEDIIGKTLEDILPAEAAATLRHYLQKTLRTGEMQVFDYSLPTADGINIRETNFVKLRETEVLGVVRDVTEKRHDKLELQDKKDHLQALFDALPDSILRFDRAGNVHAEKTSTWFYPLHTADQLTLEAVFSPEQAKDIREKLEQVFAEGGLQTTPYSLTMGTETFYRQLSLVRLNSEEALGIARDVSEEVKGQMALAASERQMRAIFSALPDLIAQFSRKGVYLGDIHSGHFPTAIPLEQAQGKTFFEMNTLTTDNAKALHAALEETFTTQKEHSHEYDLNINGKTCYREMRFVYLREDTCLGILRDITPWREMDIALQNALEHSTALLKEVHHRVRNNLQVLSSVLHLHAASLDDELAKRVLLDNRRRIQTLALVHRVLYDNNSYANIALDNYLRSGIGLFAADMQRLKVVLELNADRVSADLDHAIPFGLIVNELINNCLRHAFVSERYQSDAMSAQLQVSLQQQDNHVTLQIIDNGVGLPDDFADKQARTLGMSVIGSLSEQLAGTFSICNRDDIQGTRATLTFTC